MLQQKNLSPTVYEVFYGRHLTRVRLLGLAAELSQTVAMAVALVHDSVDDFVPRLADLIESSRLGLLALI